MLAMGLARHGVKPKPRPWIDPVVGKPSSRESDRPNGRRFEGEGETGTVKGASGTSTIGSNVKAEPKLR